MLGAADWQARWDSGDTGWDLGEASPPLCWLLQSAHAPNPGRVLLPGCGRGHELVLLADHGFFPEGWDISHTAVALAQQRTGKRGSVHLGDVLRTGPAPSSMDGIFEQTCFCAIDPQERPLYAQMVARTLKPGGWLWAVHMRVEGKAGPPFDSTPEEFIALHQALGLRQQMAISLGDQSHPRRRGRETLILMEK